MKRIGLYIPTLSHGGAERAVSRLSKILSRRYDIYIILNQEEISYQTVGSIVNLQLPAKSGLVSKAMANIRRIKKLQRVKKKYQLDCVISFLMTANLANAVSNTKGTAAVLSIRSYHELEKDKSLFGRIQSFFMDRNYKRADMIICVSREIEKAMKKRYPGLKEKLVTIYNPFDAAEIETLKQMPIPECHRKFFLDAKVLISVGRLGMEKGYGHLLRAFAKISNQDQVRLAVIGTGVQEEMLRSLALQLGIQDKVLMLGYQENPFQYIHHSYAYILSSIYEGFPNVMVEAMACGCPVIATDCKSGPREILLEEPEHFVPQNKIVKGDYGILVPPLSGRGPFGNGKLEAAELQLSKAMEELIQDEALHRQYSQAAYRRAQFFNYEVCEQSFTEVIERVTC